MKYRFYQLGLARQLDRLLFWLAQQQNRKTNHLYKVLHTGVVIPPDRDLYETYQLDYRKFMEDGALAATEIIRWTKPYLGKPNPKILDWGCGVGRITRHIPTVAPQALVYGCDTNDCMIQWNKQNYPGITFTTINSFPSTPYAPAFFDLVYGFSVFTHIDADMQLHWLAELHRVLSPNGILLITTHGSNYDHQLRPQEKTALLAKGIYTRHYPKQGHRLMTSWHQPFLFQKILEPYFEVRGLYEGKDHPQKAGGHDLWILQKRNT